MARRPEMVRRPRPAPFDDDPTEIVRPRSSPVDIAQVSSARSAVRLALERGGRLATVDETIGAYQEFRLTSPTLRASTSDSINDAVQALRKLVATEEREFGPNYSAPKIAAAYAVLQGQAAWRRELSQLWRAKRTDSARIIDLIENTMAMQSPDGGWRQRFAFVCRGVGLSGRAIAQAEALAVVDADPLLKDYEGAPIFFEDAVKATRRWKQLARRLRIATVKAT